MSSVPKTRLRAVLDTNVYISAFNHDTGIPFAIWQLAIERRFFLLTSPDIIREVAKVLREVFTWDELNILPRLKLMASTADIVVPKVTIETITDDPSDNRVLECAVEGKADLIVSGDRHLRKLKVVGGIPIIRPTDFLRTLGSRK